MNKSFWFAILPIFLLAACTQSQSSAQPTSAPYLPLYVYIDDTARGVKVMRLLTPKFNGAVATPEEIVLTFCRPLPSLNEIGQIPKIIGFTDDNGGRIAVVHWEPEAQVYALYVLAVDQKQAYLIQRAKKGAGPDFFLQAAFEPTEPDVLVVVNNAKYYQMPGAKTWDYWSLEPYNIVPLEPPNGCY